MTMTKIHIDTTLSIIITVAIVIAFLVMSIFVTPRKGDANSMCGPGADRMVEVFRTRVSLGGMVIFSFKHNGIEYLANSKGGILQISD